MYKSLADRRIGRQGDSGPVHLDCMVPALFRSVLWEPSTLKPLSVRNHRESGARSKTSILFLIDQKHSCKLLFKNNILKFQRSSVIAKKMESLKSAYLKHGQRPDGNCTNQGIFKTLVGKNESQSLLHLDLGFLSIFYTRAKKVMFRHLLTA